MCRSVSQCVSIRSLQHAMARIELCLILFGFAAQATKPAAAVFPDQQQYSPLPQQQYGGVADQQFQLPQAPGDESVAKRFNYFDLELLAVIFLHIWLHT